MNQPTRKIPAIADKINKLEARSDAIRRRLQLPCPTKYGDKEAAKDLAEKGGPGVRLRMPQPTSSFQPPVPLAPVTPELKPSATP